MCRRTVARIMAQVLKCTLTSELRTRHTYARCFLMLSEPVDSATLCFPQCITCRIGKCRRSKFRALAGTIHFHGEETSRLVGEVTKRDTACWRKSHCFTGKMFALTIRLIRSNFLQQTYFSTRWNI